MAYDVVIAGGGPVGLFLACELGLAGTSVLVLERMEDPHSPLKESWMGMRGLTLPSVAAFYRRGMLKDVQHASLAWMEPTKARLRTTLREHPPQHQHRALPDTSPASCSTPTRSISPVRNISQPGPSASGGMVSLEGIEDVSG